MTLTKLLVWTNVLVFVWLVAGAGFGAIDGSASLPFYYEHGALLGLAVTRLGEWWRIFTAAFLHGSVVHIGANMFALWIIGPDVERLMGPVRYLLLYALAIVGSGYAIVLFTPTQLTLGASGAIFGLFGALVAIGLSLRPNGMQLVSRNVPVIVLNLVLGFAIPGISNAAHIGGLITGFVAGWLLYQIPSARRAAAFAAFNPVAAVAGAPASAQAERFVPDDGAVETIEHPPDAGPHEEEGAPPLEVRDPRE